MWYQFAELTVELMFIKRNFAHVGKDHLFNGKKSTEKYN